MQNALFQSNTFFTPFADSKLTGPSGNAEAAKYPVRAQVLGKAIPALSYAVGGNPTATNSMPNFDMTTQMEDGWPQSRVTDTRILNHWFHSDSKDVAYPFTHKLWDKFVQSGNLK